jgi:hypothetical protein
MTEPKEPPPVLVWVVVGWVAFLLLLVLLRAR